MSRAQTVGPWRWFGAANIEANFPGCATSMVEPMASVRSTRTVRSSDVGSLPARAVRTSLRNQSPLHAPSLVHPSRYRFGHTAEQPAKSTSFDRAIPDTLRSDSSCGAFLVRLRRQPRRLMAVVWATSRFKVQSSTEDSPLIREDHSLFNHQGVRSMIWYRQSKGP